VQEIHIYSQEGDVLYAPCRFDFDGVLPFCAGLEGDQLGDPGWKAGDVGEYVGEAGEYAGEVGEYFGEEGDWGEVGE